MSDLISRSAVLEVLCNGCNSRNNTPVPRCGDVCSDFKCVLKLPAVDAVPVVRCKDCNLFIPYTEAHRKASGFDGDCAFLAGYADCGRECVHEMDFCSKGARMDGDP